MNANIPNGSSLWETLLPLGSFEGYQPAERIKRQKNHYCFSLVFIQTIPVRPNSSNRILNGWPADTFYLSTTRTVDT